MRGQVAHFVVQINAAREVTLPTDVAPAFLNALGRGKTLDEVMNSLCEELEDRVADELVVAGENLVLDELVSRAQPQVPTALVDEEIRRRWTQFEGKTLVELGFDVEEQREALQGWLSDPPTRADAERRVKIALVLKAVAERDRLELTKAKLEEYAALAGEAFGLLAEDVTDGLYESKDLTAQMTQTAWHLLAVEHVMASAKVSFEGAS